jgi:hypothetical protein
VDNPGAKVFFSFVQDNGGMWNLTGNNLPDWIVEIELELGYAIDDSHNEFDNELSSRN